MGRKKRDFLRLEREAVIPVFKSRLIDSLTPCIAENRDRTEFVKFCQRVEYTIRAWYLLQFEDLMQLFALFEPVHGARKLKQLNFSSEEIDALEDKFMTHLMKVMDKGNFKLTTDEEIEIAQSAQYRLALQIKVDETKLDKNLFSNYFLKYPHDHLPHFADKYIIFRRGIGLDQRTGYFIKEKINTIILRMWRAFLRGTGLARLIYGKRRERNKLEADEPVEINTTNPIQEALCVERIRLEKMNLSNKLLKKVTIQEPTFERIIVMYRLATKEEDLKRGKRDRGIYVKHFKNIPLADMEIVLPEKNDPTLTPMDWVKFLVSFFIGLATVISSAKNPSLDLRVIFAILAAVAGFCVKTYCSFQQNLVSYQSLITQTVYDKQMDSGRGTLLHLCDEVIQQEVKEVILAFFMLMVRGKATRKELDQWCEIFIKETFDETCDFDVDDAVQKLEKLGIISQDTDEKYSCVELRHANDTIGTTTEEVVLKVKDGDMINQ